MTDTGSFRPRPGTGGLRRRKGAAGRGAGVRPSLEPTLRQGQRLTMTPTIRRTLEWLRLPAASLNEAVAQELRDNPFLVRVAPESQGWAQPLPDGPASPDTLPARPPLLERLRRQIGLMQLAPEVRAMAEFLAAELREDGYLDSPPEAIAARLDVPETLVAAGLSALQGCDPPGVGATSLAECLALQLMDRAGLQRAEAEAAVARLEDFAAGRLRGMDRALGLDSATVARIAGVLPQLAAAPVQDSTAPAPILRADLAAQAQADGSVIITLDHDAAPLLRLDPALKSSAAATEEASELRARAEAVIAALNYRSATLLRIGQHLAQAQRAVFAGESEVVRPLTRREVAEALGLHASTVGRAVAGKAIDIGGRLRPLSEFFSAPLPGADGSVVSAHLVRRRLAALIAAEPPQAPLSDAALCAALNAEGVDIARRTVTKYRQWMRLPSSAARRRIAAGRRARAAQAGIPID